MVGITASKPEDDMKVTVTLVNDNNKPTPLLIALAALELTADICVGYAAYRIFKALKR